MGYVLDFCRRGWHSTRPIVIHLVAGTDETFLIGLFYMVCKVEHYERSISRQSLCRTGNDLPWNMGCGSGHVFAGE